MDVITRAMAGEADWCAFLLKILFTAVTLGAGFKGGEIVPTFFIGATFGCVVGPLLGLDPSFAAAVGLIALFCGVINCPVASFTLAVELFGGDGVIFLELPAQSAICSQAIMVCTADRRSFTPSSRPSLLTYTQNSAVLSDCYPA